MTTYTAKVQFKVAQRVEHFMEEDGFSTVEEYINWSLSFCEEDFDDVIIVTDVKKEAAT